MNMSFGRLLAAGKSLMPGGMAGRYQMHENLRLPRFISPRNPFAAETTAEESTSQAAKLEERGDVVSAVTPIRKLSAALGRTGEATKRVALWCLDHNPFSAIGRPQLPTLPRFGKPPVQGELTLENVKVVRGDLAHADLEVVAKGGPAKLGMRKLTARVFAGGNR